jgi:hypothetical protein
LRRQRKLLPRGKDVLEIGLALRMPDEIERFHSLVIRDRLSVIRDRLNVNGYLSEQPLITNSC